MQLCSAIITVKHIRLAIVLVDIESTHAPNRVAVLLRAQAVFPALPIILLSPRIGGFSHSYATFDLDHIIGLINADEITWGLRAPVSLVDDKTPF